MCLWNLDMAIHVYYPNLLRRKGNDSIATISLINIQILFLVFIMYLYLNKIPFYKLNKSKSLLKHLSKISNQFPIHMNLA